MSADAPAGRRRPDLASTLGLLAAVVAAMMPLLTVLTPGPWLVSSLTTLVLVLATGYLLRRAALPAAVVTLAGTAVAVLLTTAFHFAGRALLGIIPTAEVLVEVERQLPLAVEQISTGVAPVTPLPALAFLITAATAALVVALDHVVLTARMPLLASVALIAVWLVPSLATRFSVDAWSFVFLAAAVLFLVRAEMRSRAPASASARATAGAGVVAAVIAVVAIVGSLVATPLLPAPSRSGGIATGTTIDASLELGDDLRRPGERRVLTMRTDTGDPPYLRVATLTDFDGESWEPDRTRTVPLDDDAFVPPPLAADIEVTETVTSVEIVDLASGVLPVPFPAVDVRGADGAWRVAPYNRVVTSPTTTAQRQSYEVVTRAPRPTREQAQAASAPRTSDQGVDAVEVPSETPASVAQLAAEVTAGAETDYDRLIALQTWFRGSEFAYSLDAPVEEGFDGSGAEAIGAFLEVREGYCIHFASAFALMARTLGMPTRIVVGFLPGAETGDRVDGRRVFEVTTSQLHAWPEVRFDDLGWVAFEPTKSLGTPTRFSSGETDAPDDEGATPTASPSATASPAPTVARPDEPDAGVSTGAPPIIDLRPLLWPAVIAGVVLGVPALLRALRAGLLRRRLRAGDEGAAWRLVQDTALDLGIPVPGAESPRAFGTRLRTVHGAPDEETRRLVDVVERASYAPPSAAPAGADLERLAAEVSAGLLRAAPPRQRTVARLFPRSLAVRPGSVLADPRTA